ncbi:hypothetical protein [Arthrobacter oryzae]|uniref:hypothetical protein n=1 Tax=Arthrobacter oryzae TaxID=409290 RepID=UPI0028665C20|nr:hypothetical protein [Arthrobacter oryzae]MDR6507232.1 hypothetical protein [Arthrobacter oryzae]
MQPPQGHGTQPGHHQRVQAQKNNRLGRTLAVAATALIGVLLFAGYAAFGRGASNEEMAQAMIAKADDLPENDWQLVERADPDAGCVATDSACVRLSATWSVPQRVGLADTASRLGVDMSGPPMGLFSGCLKSKMEDGGMARVCIDPVPELDDNWFVSIELTVD